MPASHTTTEWRGGYDQMYDLGDDVMDRIEEALEALIEELRELVGQ